MNQSVPRSLWGIQSMVSIEAPSIFTVYGKFPLKCFVSTQIVSIAPFVANLNIDHSLPEKKKQYDCLG